MNQVFNNHGAATDLSRLSRCVTAGKGGLVARADKPIARLAPVDNLRRRELGYLKHVVGPEPEGAFDPVTPEQIAEWE